MIKIDDGGPAFPVVFEDTRGLPVVNGGMRLRDWFAGQALAAMSSSGDWSTDAGDDMSMLARHAYEISDAMIAARNTEASR